MAEQPPRDQGERRAGLVGSLRALAATLVAIAHTRLELVGVELREEFARLGAVLLWGYLALFCGSVAMVLLTLALAVLWAEHRLIVLGVAAALFLVLALLAARAAVAVARRKPRLFEASLTELEHDNRQLRDRP
ncbi:MAG TPA: phage holin family protein [Burkholderiales bacterium]|nr:phage holin family protein [Burkholderiales bacterium]